VAVDAFGGDEGAHGEAVDEVVVERLAGERVGGGNLAGGAVVGLVVLRLDEVEGVLSFRNSGCAGVNWRDAEALLRRFGDEGFGIDGAGEMHVQVGAFGHRPEEGVELTGAEFLRGFERVLGVGFTGGGDG
jgi:hypothetical protein